MAKLADATYRIIPKRGKNDCAIAVLATYLQREYEDVLLAAAKVRKDVWGTGLAFDQIPKVARRLGVTTRWYRVGAFDIEEATGVLWVGYHDVSNQHVVFLHEGQIFDPEHNPVSMWDHDDFMRHMAAYPQQLLMKVED